MKKLISFLLLLSVLVSALSLTSCHGNKAYDEFVMPEAFDTGKQIEISFWAKNDTNMTQVEIYKQAIKDFEAIYPNVKVKLKLYTDYGRLYSDVITNISTRTTPNVCITYPDHIATYKSGENLVVPLDDLIADPKYGLGGSELSFDGVTENEIIPAFLDEGIIDGEQYALPFMRSTEACYVNKTYVEALGYELPEVLTWDFIWEVSEAAMAKNEDGTYKVNGQETLIPFIYKSTDNMMIQMLKQMGADYSNENGEVLIFNDDTKNILYTVAEHAETRAFSTFKISSYPANFLNAGQCIFAIDSTAGATWMGSDAPLIDIPEDKLVEFETVVKTIPQYDTKKPVMISQGPSMCIFNKDDPQVVLASWLFMQFMLTNDVQIAYSQTEGYAPVTSKAQNSAEYIDYLSRSGEDNEFYYSIKLDATKLLLDNINNTFVTPVFNGSASLRNAAGQMIEEVTKSKRRAETVDDAYIEELYNEMSLLYKLTRLGDSEKNQKNDLGKLPGAAVALITTICTVWVVLTAYEIWQFVKKRRDIKTKP